MKKLIAKMMLFALILNYALCLIPLDVEAYQSSDDELVSRNVCGSQLYELAYANNNGTLTTKACYSTYPEAKSAMDVSTEANSDNLVVLERKDGRTRVIDAKYAIVDLDKGNATLNTDVLPGPEDGAVPYTYINGASAYGASDAAFLGYNEGNRRAKIKISGVVGWVREIDQKDIINYKIVPLAWVKSTTKYVVTDTSIVHYTTANIYNTNYNNSFAIGPKPTMLNKGTYYSYDGNYFYSDLKSMLADYKEGSTNRSVNKEKPYYNYYQYVPHHTKTTYSGSEIDAYLSKRYSEYFNYPYSALYGEGYAFFQAQEMYGVNALMMLAVAQNESNHGRSRFALGRNNLFGHNAYDIEPGKALDYASIRAGINSHAVRYMTYGYAFPSDSRFYGSHLGNKVMGANVKYASDPYWGEKAAANYYQLDVDLQDYNYYQLAIKSKSGTIYPASRPSLDVKYRISTIETTREPYYNYGRNGSPVVILDTVQGEAVDGNTTWYKIMSDANVDQNHKHIGYKTGTYPTYNWELNYVYVPAAYYTKINDGVNNSPLDVTDYEEKYYTYETYTDSTGYPTPQVAKINHNNTKLYYSPTLQEQSKTSWNQGQYVLVFEKAYDGNKSLKSYQITSSFGKGFKEWTTPDAISFQKMTYAHIEITNPKAGLLVNVRKEPGKEVVATVANGAYVIVYEQKQFEGNNWLKVYIDGAYGWVRQHDDDQNIPVYTSTLENTPPTISCSDTEVPINSVFDIMTGVSATDIEDGNITSKIKVVSNNLDTSKIGVYTVIYEVTDSSNTKTTKTRKITVKERQTKNGLFSYNATKQIQNDTFEVSGFLAITGMNNARGTGVKHYFILQNELTSQEYRFEVANWEANYPYDMSNVDDDKPYDYSGGWFKGNVDFSTVPEGDYIAYVEVTNGMYQARMLYQNLVYKEMPKKVVTSSNRGYVFQMNYYIKTRPLNITIRNNGLLASSIPPTTDRMYNSFESINLSNNQLHIRGTSHNVGIGYGKEKQVTRKIVLENVTTFERKEQEVGSITNGDYIVDLKVSDGLDKTRAWYDGSIDIANLEKGVYAIYIVTSVDGFSDFGELKDLSYRTFTDKVTINGKNYSLRRVDGKRFRMELVVE